MTARTTAEGTDAQEFARWPADMRWNFVVLGADIAVFVFGLSISSAYTVLPLFVHFLTPSNEIAGADSRGADAWPIRPTALRRAAL